MNPTVVFRADGHAKMGLGHVVRSLAFAEILKNHFDCKFAIKAPSSTLIQQIKLVCSTIWILPDSLGSEVEEAAYLVKNYLSGNEILILDGYHFRTQYQRKLKDLGCQIICIDDIHNYHFLADVIINHAGGVTADCYSTGENTQFFLGLKYALLRKEFREAAKERNYPERGNAVLICLGGADPNNDTLDVLKECEQKGIVEKYYIIIGGAYQYRKELEAYIATLSKEIILLSSINASEMVRYMKKCTMAVTSPSTISYEYLSVGGELYLKVIADNQININRYFVDKGLAFSFKEFPVSSAERISKAIAKQEQILDGKSGERLLELVTNLSTLKQGVKD